MFFECFKTFKILRPAQAGPDPFPAEAESVGAGAAGGADGEGGAGEAQIAGEGGAGAEGEEIGEAFSIAGLAGFQRLVIVQEMQGVAGGAAKCHAALPRL